MEKSLEIDLSIKCPKTGLREKINGTCCNFKITDPQDNREYVVLHGNDIPYSAIPKCEFLEGVTTGYKTHLLREISCKYKHKTTD